MSFEPGTQLGSYTIVREIGRGGMATVYLAHHNALERDVAVKVLPEFFASDQAFRDRFVREATSVAKLRHPNILTVFDYGEQDSNAYLVTEYVEGTTLEAKLGSPMPLDEVVRLLRPVAEALDYAHGRGVIHRDVKPSNIFISGDGTPVLGDFGLVRLTGSFPRLTLTGVPVGTPEYMAPEQGRGDEDGTSVDDYALAVIAFEMLTGSVPFKGETPIAVLLAHVTKPLPRPRSLNPELPVEAEAILIRALAKVPSERFGSGAEFVSELDKVCSRIEQRYLNLGRIQLSQNEADDSTALDNEERWFDPARPVAVRKASHPLRDCLSEIVQRPVTLGPLTFAALAVIYGTLLGPVWGGTTVAYSFGGLLALIGVAGAVVSFPAAFAQQSDLILREEDAVQRDEAARGVEELYRTLDQDFDEIEYMEGSTVLRGLRAEYQQLSKTLPTSHGNQPAVLLSLPADANKTMTVGLSVLADVLEVVSTVRTSGANRLRRDVGEIEKELEGIRDDPSLASRAALLRDNLAHRRHLLEEIEDLAGNADRLLSQAERCEGALRSARIRLVNLRFGQHDGNVDSVNAVLLETIEIAREVQQAVQEQLDRFGRHS